MAGDWIKLHRRVLDHPVMQHDGICRLWQFLLLRANWKDAQWMVPGSTNTIIVRRGQIVTGREALHSKLYGPEYRGEGKPSSRTVWRWLESLEQMGCVRVQSVSNRFSVVTIVKYDTYQALEEGKCPDDVQLMSNPCPTDVQPLSTIEEGKKEKKEEECLGASADATKVAPVFRPESLLVPPELDTPAFLAARDRWFAQRRARRLSLRENYVAGQYEKLAQLGVTSAIECLDFTVQQDYQGLLFDRFTARKPIKKQRELPKMAGRTDLDD